jgi:Interferon-induced 6-16 family
MADPFDQVLRRLALYERIQSLIPIPVVYAQIAIANDEVPCRVRVRLNETLLPVSNPIVFNIPHSIRECWVLNIIKFVHFTVGITTNIRPIDLILHTDGSVQASAVQEKLAENDSANMYPAPYRIPPSTIMDLPLRERIWRAEKFALGTIIYEVLCGHTPFQFGNLADWEIQDRYRRAKFPIDVEDIDLHPLLYACWSAEFGRYIALNKFERYVHDNPVRFGLQVTGAVVSTAAIIVFPILGAVGFSAIGPVAGSVAAGWQSAIGAVEAGSLFAFCQSAAMGGVAAATLTGTAATGAGAAVLASGLPGPSSLRAVFVRKFRQGL